MSVRPGRSAKSRACAASSAGGVAINTWPTRAAPSPSFKPHRRFGSSRWCWSSGSTVQTVVPSAASQLGPARRADSSRSLRPGRTAAMRRAVRMSCRRVLLRAAISSWRRQGRVYQLPKILCGSGQLNSLMRLLSRFGPSLTSDSSYARQRRIKELMAKCRELDLYRKCVRASYQNAAGFSLTSKALPSRRFLPQA